MTLTEHARRELELLGEDHGLTTSIVTAVAAFDAFPHSGASEQLATDLLARLLRRENLTPLTSVPAEWADRSAESGYPLWQAVRNPAVFSTDAGATHWTPGTPGTLTVSAPAAR